MNEQVVGGYRLGDVVRRTRLGPVLAGADAAGRQAHVLVLRRPEQVSEESWTHTIARFDADVRTAAALEHPRILRVLSQGRHGDTYYVAYEAVEGKTLAEKVQEEGSPSLARAVPRIAQIAAALTHAHERGVVHGDLCPSEVLVTADGTALVSGFGMAHIPRHTVMPYTAPEVLDGGLPDALSDIFSLGAVLYEMLAGRPPYAGRTPEQIRETILAGRPPEPLAEQPPYLQAIVLKALSREPVKRYPSAAAMLADVHAQRQPAGFERRVVVPELEAEAAVEEWRPAPGQAETHAAGLDAAISAAEHIEGVVKPPPRRIPRVWLRRAALACVLLLAAALVRDTRRLMGHATLLEAAGVKGSVRLTPLGASVSSPVGSGSEVRAGDSIETGADGSVWLRATDGTMLRVGPATRVLVARLGFSAKGRTRDRLFYLDKGRLLVRAARQRPGSRLAVVAGRVRAAVVGTQFSVESAEGTRTLVGVLEGTVKLSAGAEEQPVAAGQQARAVAGRIAKSEALPEEQRKLLEQAIEEAGKLEGAYASLTAWLSSAEEGAAAGLESVTAAFHRAAPANPDQGGDAGALARAMTSMLAICNALETADEGDYPAHLEATTLKELGLGAEDAKAILASFDGEKLLSYRRAAGTYEFTARARDAGHTPLKASRGRVERVE